MNNFFKFYKYGLGIIGLYAFYLVTSISTQYAIMFFAPKLGFENVPFIKMARPFVELIPIFFLILLFLNLIDSFIKKSLSEK